MEQIDLKQELIKKEKVSPIQKEEVKLFMLM